MKKATRTEAITKQPATKQHMLVAVTGHSPQIVTETLYALAVKQKPPIPISAVYILTTAKGAEIAWDKLGGPEGGIARLRREYDLGWEITFSRKQILIFKRRTDDGREVPLEDVRTSEDNETLAAQLLGYLKSLTADPQVALHCAMGGGRRTMSAYMMLAMMMYGREDDQLTHVLVPDEFETNPDFFFPPKHPQSLPVRLAGNRLGIVNTRDAIVELADIPFVRLRAALGAEIEKVEKGLQDLITIAQQKIDRSQPDKLVIDLPRRQARFGTQPIALRGIRLALLAWYADTKVTYCVERERPVCGDCQACFQNPADDDARFQQLYRQVYTRTQAQFDESGEGKLDPANLMAYHSKINKTLRPLSIKIDAQRQWGGTRYGVSLDKNLIEFIK